MSENQDIRKEITPKAEPVHTGDLDKAIERIYERYGNDLQAFFRDTRESIERQRLSSDKSEPCIL